MDPPVLVPPDVLAGGRSTNGLVWMEHLANDVGATIKDYAVCCSHWLFGAEHHLSCPPDRRSVYGLEPVAQQPSESGLPDGE